jgi:hypothetical protein
MINPFHFRNKNKEKRTKRKRKRSPVEEKQTTAFTLPG